MKELTVLMEAWSMVYTELGFELLYISSLAGQLRQVDR
jgi:hypothetical protein